VPVAPVPPPFVAHLITSPGCFLWQGIRSIFMPDHAHPLIRFVDGPTGRRASLVGAGLDVWEVIATIRDND